MLNSIPVFAAALTLTGAYLLDKAGDFHLESFSGTQDIHFVETKNSVKWRNRKSFYWHDVSKGFHTGHPGRVQTLEGATAKIRLSDSHELLISPNSIVEIDLKSKDLNLISGKIFINKIFGGKSSKQLITVNDQPMPEFKQEQDSIVFLKNSESDKLQTLNAPQSEVASIKPDKVETVSPKPRPLKKMLPRTVQTPVAEVEPIILPQEITEVPAQLELPPSSLKESHWNKIAGINLPVRFINILSDNLGKAEGLLLIMPGIDVSFWEKKEINRIRFDYSWSMLRSQSNSNVVYLHSHDISGSYIFKNWGVGVSLLGRDVLALENRLLVNYSYISPTVDLLYSLKTETENKEIDTIAYFSPLLYAVPLSGQAMGMGGWRFRLQNYFFNKKLWHDYQVGPSLGLFYESTSFKYTVLNSEVGYQSNTFGINLGYSIKF